jgi:hypothetical protein
MTLARTCLLVNLLLAALVEIQAQPFWAAAGLPERCNPMRQVYAPESAGDEVYIVGRIILDTSAFWYPLNPVMRYAAGSWDTLGYVQWGFIESIVEYHDTLIIGGNFTLTDDGTACEGILYWANGAWHPYGDLEHQVRRLRVLDDTLYATGGFHSADGQPAMGIARREGGQWVPVGTVQDPDVLMLDVIKYQGHLIAIGNGYINGLRGIFQFDGTQWSALGQGIVGGVSGGACLAVYGGDLYVGGQLSIPEGNAGQEIMRWDGSAFHAVGTGLQWQLGDLLSFSTCADMKVHDGLLWVCGGFNYAGGVEAHGVATWDGSRWCGVQGDLVRYQNGGVASMDFYGDTLFVACGDTADGQYMNKAAKFIGTSYADTCSGPVGVPAFESQADMQVAYNAVLGLITVQASVFGEVVVIGPLGQVVARTRGRNLHVPTAGWSPGIYMVRAEGHRAHKVLVY